ncbi:hypothetical protein Q0F98_28245 [Paenibacillus amylolyticus]|uniref:hypothetical protein n=1 Tax=Paenibacillus sp. Y5S-9 TaxID=3122489 RepID=UPI0030CDD99E|nr:hypothetical protein Q0F98_28245 [Paenibacillus amylolyticus]
MVRSTFIQLSSTREKIIDKLLTSKDLMKAVAYDTADYLEQSIVADPKQYIYKRIFPHRCNPDENEDVLKTVVSISLENILPVQHQYKAGILCFNVYTHRQLCQSNSELLRTDFIISKIDELFARNQDLGLGRLEFYKMDVLDINSNYYGDSIAYRMLDFA